MKPRSIIYNAFFYALISFLNNKFIRNQALLYLVVFFEIEKNGPAFLTRQCKCQVEDTGSNRFRISFIHFLSGEPPVLGPAEEVGLAVRPGEAGVEVAREAVPIL